eukprot:6466462-Amphidinium_carterae.2
MLALMSRTYLRSACFLTALLLVRHDILASSRHSPLSPATQDQATDLCESSLRLELAYLSTTPW